jgi:hypothetical protein
MLCNFKISKYYTGVRSTNLQLRFAVLKRLQRETVAADSHSDAGSRHPRPRAGNLVGVRRHLQRHQTVRFVLASAELCRLPGGPQGRREGGGTIKGARASPAVDHRHGHPESF